MIVDVSTGHTSGPLFEKTSCIAATVTITDILKQDASGVLGSAPGYALRQSQHTGFSS